MNLRRIEVRYIEQRQRWKATFLSDRRQSVYGTDAHDAMEYLCKMLRIAPEICRVVSQSKDRHVYEVRLPPELVDTQSG